MTYLIKKATSLFVKKSLLCFADKNFNLWYDYEQHIVNDLLSENVTSVKAKVVDDRTIRDRLFDEKCIVDLRSDSAVYYDIETEKTELDEEYISLWVVFFLVFIVLLCDTAITLLVYDVVGLKKEDENNGDTKTVLLYSRKYKYGKL